MKIDVHLSNTRSGHIVEGATEGRRQSIDILPKSVGQGSNVSGGELLFAALATCFCKRPLPRGGKTEHQHLTGLMSR
jgi:organic hydroperoxide reductase OsmC/OhrA